MSAINPTPTKIQKDSPVADGRRLRTHRNREKVIQAMLEIVREGKASPAAEEVAARAGVGLRSVFRYFDDIESLVHEMIMTVEAEIHPIALRPLVSDTAEGRVDELIFGRIEFFEQAMPFKIVAAAKRYKSKKLMECYNRDQELMHQWMLRALPEDVVQDQVSLEALDAILSFEMWRRIRKDQGKTIDEGCKILTKMVRGILK